MALSLQDGRIVWAKVDQFLANLNASPVVQAQFRGLKENVVGALKNPQLQFISFDDADLVQATGVSPIGGVTSTVYGVYFIKNGTGVGNTTAMWLTLNNATTNTVLATKLVLLHTAIAAQEMTALYPKGKIFATDLTLTAENASLDGTEVASGAAGTGFVIVGA